MMKVRVCFEKCIKERSALYESSHILSISYKVFPLFIHSNPQTNTRTVHVAFP